MYDSNIRSSPSYKFFRKRILKYIRPSPNRTFNVPNCLGLTYLTRLRDAVSHYFQDSLNPVCNCINAIE